VLRIKTYAVDAVQRGNLCSFYVQVEVALKMAFRKFMVDHGLLQQQDGSTVDTQLEVRLTQTPHWRDILLNKC
jgi:hypothetical protein